jgi:uncharacterized membrane protein YeaQ/YmgE (transglycosylase-associated protein family)
MLVPGKQAIGFLWTIVLGLAGAAVGWLVFTKLLGIGDDDAFDLGGLVGAVIGSVVLLIAYLRFEGHDGGSASPVAH